MDVKDMTKKVLSVSTALVAAAIFLSGSVLARTALNPKDKGSGDLMLTVGVPSHGLAGHRVGDIVLGVNNNGTFGTGFSAGSTNDFFTGEAVPSCEYPKNSSIQYLFAGAFWIGAIVGRDTLVSVGADGWQLTREMFPDDGEEGEMKYRSIIDPSKPEYQDAVSEEDYVSVYTDTYTRGVAADFFGRSHIPLHIEVTDASYAWSYSYAKDIVLFDYKIKNIGVRRLENVYMGLYVDADVCFDCTNTNGFTDDLCGFVHSSPAYCKRCEYEDDVNIAWIADNDGDLTIEHPCPHVTASRIVRTPADSLDVSFNWWIGNGNPSLDFGPREQSEKGRWKEKFRDFATGGLGTPEGDVNKYYQLRNQEFDYDQAFTATIAASDTLWLYPSQALAPDFANGYDTRYLLSFGPFTINPGEVLPLSFAYMAGANFHADRTNLRNLPDRPDLYYQNLNFSSGKSNLSENSRWASWIYDNPGVDTDGDLDFGEKFICGNDSIKSDSTKKDSVWEEGTWKYTWKYSWLYTDADTCWIVGDGVPDFKGASPPPSPSSWSNVRGISAMRILPATGKVTVRFNGMRSETTKDVFSGYLDFEGYRVYYGRDERATSFQLAASYDVEDYNKYVWDEHRSGGAGYSLIDIPYSRRQLQCAYGTSCDDSTFNPLDWTQSRPYRPALHPDSAFYFRAQDYNVSRLGIDTKIVKRFPNQPYPSSLDPIHADTSEVTEDGFLKYFEYELEVVDLLPTVPWFFNVTAFDFGSPLSGLPSLETSTTVGAVEAYPQPTTEDVARRGLKVYVYPNPYRVDDDYAEHSFEEQPSSTKNADRLRRVHFANLPAKCTISIFSLDGDLVRELVHDVASSDPTASHETWDLITRNTQMAVSGLYYWTVEDDQGQTQIGKLVLIM
jgi:hypothetical protein